MRKGPLTFDIATPGGVATRYDHHIMRPLSSMLGQYADRQAHEAALLQGDPIVYEVYDVDRPGTAGDLVHGISIVRRGKVGDEYYMTKGHFHARLETAEVYLCLRGQGVMVMETLEGECAVEELRPGRVLHVPPCWAHRSVNTSLTEDLVTFFVYPADAGHDYGTIEERGFRKLVVDRGGRPQVIDNPRWREAEGGR